MVVGPVAFAYNVDGVDKLVLNAETLAQIFNGTIKTWNDPKIAKLNSGRKAAEREHHGVLPLRRVRHHREHRLSSWPTLATVPGRDEPAKAWTGTGEGKNKSSGVAEATASTKNSITYIEWSYAKDNKLSMAELDSGNGPVELTGDSVAKAVSEAKVKGTGNDLSLDLKYSGHSERRIPCVAASPTRSSAARVWRLTRRRSSRTS